VDDLLTFRADAFDGEVPRPIFPLEGSHSPRGSF
jgi:hypothetical protein